tara:strand:+ start:4108 stop:5553 length:1446 start_codon:yes stop_codon:yes gene_type:complete
MPQRKFYIIDPNSQPADGIISYKNGNTNLAFNIQESDTEFLIGSSVKLCFKFVIRDGTNAEAVAQQVYVSPQCGLHGLISSISVHSYSTNQQISNINNYPRLVSTLLSNGLADRYDADSSQQQAGISRGIEYNSSNVGIYGVVAPTLLQSYSIRPYVGSIIGVNWYLGSTLKNGCGGLKINFNLASDGSALTSQATATTEYSYELQDVKLMYQTYVGTDEEQMAGRLRSDYVKSYTDSVREEENRQPSGAEINQNWQSVVSQGANNPAPIRWRDYTNYLTTIQSDNANVSLQLGLSKVHSIFANFVTSSYINNITTLDADSNKTYAIYDTTPDQVPWDRLTMTKGGELFPAKFTLSTNIKTNNYQAADDHTADRRAEIVKYYLDSVMPYVDNKYQQGSSENTLWFNQHNPSVKEDLIGDKCAGIGTGQLSVLDGSSDFTFEPLGLQVDSDNKGTFANTTAYIYALAERRADFTNGTIAVSS